MAAEGADDDTRPVAGFFGKLPGSGDFVDRGLPPGFRRQWDRWLTSHVAPRARAGARFPVGGLRFRLVSGRATAGGVILPSQDSVGRVFPLSLLVIAEGGIVPAAIDRWCDAAVAGFDPAVEPDTLWDRLDALAPPEVVAGAGEPCLTLWSAGRRPERFEEDEARLTELLPCPD